MTDDDSAFQLYERAMALADTNPSEALSLLAQVVAKYPDTPTASNYAVEQIIEIATRSELWDQAISGCELACKLKPRYRESYALEIEALRLDKSGNPIAATEKRYERSILSGEWYSTTRDFGDTFASLGDHDRAWALYNRAATLAVEDSASPHTVRQSMANLLMSEGKVEQAAELLITGVAEAAQYAKKGVPRSLRTHLKKVLRELGIKDATQAGKLVDVASSLGAQRAIDSLSALLHSGP